MRKLTLNSQPVLVMWRDSQLTGGGWCHLGEMSDPDCVPMVQSVGFIIAKTPDCIQLAQNAIPEKDDSQISNLILIPRGCIERIIILSRNGEYMEPPGDGNWPVPAPPQA